MASEQESEVVTTLFHVANETGQKVKVKVLVDGRELFVRELTGTRKPEADTGAAPGPSPYPAVEVKVTLPRNAKGLEVREMITESKNDFNIANFLGRDAGFRIRIQKRKILLTQDYHPVR